MKRVLLTILGVIVLQAVAPISLVAQSAGSPQAAESTGEQAAEVAKDAMQAGPQAAQRPHDEAVATAAAAGVAAEKLSQQQRPPDLLEYLVDAVLDVFDMSSSGNTLAHYTISALFLIAALLARRIVTGIIFAQMRKLASRTRTTFDNKLLPAMEGPAAAFIMIVGMFAALKVLKLPDETNTYLRYGWTVAMSLAVFWGLWRLLGATLDHGHEVARQRQLGIAAFMPWIRKTLLTIFLVVGVLLTVQSLGFDVKALLAGLGIGGLAFALAAQDTLANVFGSIVVATDQPFKIGEAIRISGNIGIVEDIGLRSTRIRLIDKSLMIIPNKTVASETITNFSRFTRRRVEQVIGLTYESKPEQMDEMATAIRELLSSQPEIDRTSVMVFFRDFSASSLDLWVVYEMPDPDFQKSMFVRQRMNTEIMRLAQARGLSFAFPTQTLYFEGDVARQLAERHPPAASAPRNGDTG